MSETPGDSLPSEPKVYEVVKFVNPRDAVAAGRGWPFTLSPVLTTLTPMESSSGHPECDGCMVSFHDVLTDGETVRTDIRNFVEIIVPVTYSAPN